MANAQRLREIKEEVFYKMTGYLAPGKDWPAADAANPKNNDTWRQEVWDEWINTHGRCVETTWAVAEDEIHDIHLQYKEDGTYD